ncbi:molybdenum cofactor guanylyltransferase [Leifsonia shinshuensis]|uniref:molybdenum cofactor guanylyltransferase n=1 Tax=Leifsonia shinshuensis TaxID=150026 RepID=UPI0028661FB8|nr:molybdenum cofactor guanylyltransferase [Leifsonia shinshuensis]MDR6972073.1 molybdopterin-guanine dinucleotide biosynthesis protein A [Leifsonia shinshuensis]
MRPAAIILAGGRSRRMGVPKHSVSLGGRTLVERVLDAVAPFPSVVVGPLELGAAVSRHPQASLTRERPAYSGPVAAIAAGVDELDRRRIGADTALILSCDLAYPVGALGLLLEAAHTHPDAVVLSDCGRPQWLCGLYLLDPIRDAVARLRSTSSLDSARVSTLCEGLALRMLDDAAGLSFDIDTPADLAAAISEATG